MNRKRYILAGAALAALMLGPDAVGAARWLFTPVAGCLRSDAWRDQPELIAMHVIGDGLTTVAYVGIPIALLLIWRRLKTRPEAKLLGLFGAFILLCGWTHADDIVTIWHPVYRLSAAAKVATGIVSVATLIALARLAPQLMGIGRMATDLQAARDEADKLRRVAEQRADKAEGEVDALAAAQAEAQEARAKAETRAKEAERMRREAVESARVAEAARQQAEAAMRDKRAAQEAVRELSTPVLPIADRVLALPLIGTVDSLRAEQAIEAIMHGVAEHQAEVVILDLTGVPVVDTQVANALLKASAAVSLLGARCVLTGIRPAVAQTMVDLGIDMSMVATKATLRAGLTAAMGMVRA